MSKKQRSLMLLFVSAVLVLSMQSAMSVESESDSNIEEVTESPKKISLAVLRKHEQYQACILKTVGSGAENMTIESIRELCVSEVRQIIAQRQAQGLSTIKGDADEIMVITSKKSKDEIIEELNPIEKRVAKEQQLSENRFAILPHKQNYILPLTYSEKLSEGSDLLVEDERLLDNTEIKFQVSFKTPVWNEIFGEDSALFFGYTGQSYWQAYNSDLSSPFRETNHQPELFVNWQTDAELGDWKMPIFTLGVEHQSNGRSGLLSRSWNRVYATFAFENENWVLGFKPWYRIPEKDKEYVGDPSGDDNPDIHEYMGYFEAFTAYKWDDHNIIAMFRNTLHSNNRGAFQLDWSFPLDEKGKLRGYIQYFNGYGESLIDYNRNTNRLGVGFLLTDWL